MVGKSDFNENPVIRLDLDLDLGISLVSLLVFILHTEQPITDFQTIHSNEDSILRRKMNPKGAAVVVGREYIA